MLPRLRAIAARQGGLLTRRQAREVGCTERELRTMTAVHGPWVVVRRGVYCERERWEHLATVPDGQAGLRDRAVHLSTALAHLMSHDSAARALGVPMLRPRHELSHLTREGIKGTRTEHGVKHHLTQLGLLNTVDVQDMITTGLARTALDLAREHGVECGVVAVDHVLRRGIEPEDLQAELLAMWCWPNITRARAAAQLADAGSESPGESLTRLVLVSLGLGPVHTQHPIMTEMGQCWADLRLGRHLVEFDGRTKFVDRESGGVAARRPEDVLWLERRRQLLMCEQDHGMSRVTWRELLPDRREELSARLRREYLLTARRFGTELTATERQYVVRMAGARRARQRHREPWPRIS